MRIVNHTNTEIHQKAKNCMKGMEPPPPPLTFLSVLLVLINEKIKNLTLCPTAILIIIMIIMIMVYDYHVV